MTSTSSDLATDTAPPAPTPDVPPAGPLLGTACDTCNRQFFPARDRCPTCWGTELPVRALAPEGVVATWTVVRLGKRFPTPYALCYADFPGDVRVLGRVVNWRDGTRIRPGATIRTHPLDTEVDGRTVTTEHVFTIDPSDLED